MLLLRLPTARRRQVQLLGAGGDGLVSERPLVLRRRSHEALPHGDADPGRQHSHHHGETQGVPRHLKPPIKKHTRGL